MIILSKQQYQSILEHSMGCLPNEACGLIGGKLNEDKKTIDKVYTLTNIDNSNEHFSMDPKEQFEAVKDMRNVGLELLGNFHSHPESPARPSEEDKRLAFDPNASYMILSLIDVTNPVLKSFKIANGTAVEEIIFIEEDI